MLNGIAKQATDEISMMIPSHRRRPVSSLINTLDSGLRRNDN
ncbi:hypothetical protein MIZ01_0098 [Sideroxyarcus emersonii]|uniref:Uncharacterized protein n=1 Tax=Sideroxyarcus emersonii TaxID=2764705 RepID=A0AAN1X7V8_9PROT|nr:hypothetical protein MIZ01_0098 [Sideroxyarcus emersonii]